MTVTTTSIKKKNIIIHIRYVYVGLLCLTTFIATSTYDTIHLSKYYLTKHADTPFRNIFTNNQQRKLHIKL